MAGVGSEIWACGLRIFTQIVNGGTLNFSALYISSILKSLNFLALYISSFLKKFELFGAR